MRNRTSSEGKVIGKPTVILPKNLVGRFDCWHFNAKRGVWIKKVSMENTIHPDLKEVIRENLYANSDFALDNLFDVDGQIWGDGGHAAGDPNGKDGMLFRDTTNNLRLTAITVIHPDDPSGDYYKQWRGTLTNDFGIGSISIFGSASVDAYLGHDHNSGSDPRFDIYYATVQNVPEVVMLANDILVGNWKVSIA